MLHKIANILTLIFLNCRADNSFYVGSGLLLLFGMWGVFRKCGIKPFRALIPCLREVGIGEAVGMEKEGRITAFLEGTAILLSIIELFISDLQGKEGTLYSIFLFLQIFTGLILLIYQIRLYLGLIEVFNRKRRWIILWVFAEWLAAPLWGWMKKYQPLWKAQEMKVSAANYFSGSRAEVLDQGLTVNLEERTAVEFFKKKYLLRDIHMYIQPGHMVLLLGGSGAGKTTYLNAVNGYEKAKAEVILNG
ncbi:MAG: ATP-binding cassette domain-containing protein, partial [Clostridia bacterium]|nr:ATP-binding cassette domain-containing protein [Clostridia bacterium]